MKDSVCLKRISAILALGCHTLFAAVTFYFLPPDNDQWVAGNSYLYDGDNKTAELMQIHTRCGWFKKEFNSIDDVPENVLIFLGSKGKDVIDQKGIRADHPDSANSAPSYIPLKTRFGTSSALYYYQNLANGETDFVFGNSNPPDLGEEKAGRCSYKMAAFIYDTDGSVNPSFSGTYTAPSTANANIRRGIVASTLDTTDGKRKPTFIASPGYANWRNKESFDAAFTPEGKIGNTITNIARCYDMPFTRSGTNWEFDSDKMRTPNDTYLVGGFFPYILDSAYNDDGSAAEYAEKCPACNKKYTVSCFQNPSDSTNRMTKLWRDSTYTGVAAFERTWIPDGVSLGTYYGNAPAGCAVRPGPGNGGTTTNRANLSFCFESHAQFTYEKGQEFLFRGDDDIWVFINNQLVIDLGGVHNAAPGYVDLDTIKVPEVLKAGETYPIDIFFCERMATQSNVRVSTNMYITQKTSFYNEPEGRRENWMCASIRSGNDCAANKASAGVISQKDICGDNLIDDGNYKVDFYMVKRGDEKDTIWLSEKNKANCTGDITNFTCLAKDGVEGSGINVKKAVYVCGGRDQCKGNATATSNVKIPSGNWNVYARLVYANGSPVTTSKPLLIDNLKSPTDARIVWGEVNGEDDILDLYNSYGDDPRNKTKRNQSIIAGRRTPIYIAVGKWVDPKKYTSFDLDDIGDDIVEYFLSGTEDLKVYSDSFGKKIATFPRKIGKSGIDTLWVMGDYEMGEKEFDLNLDGIVISDDTPSMKLTVYQPKLRFVTTDNTTDFINSKDTNYVSGYSWWTNDILPPYVDQSLEVYIVAWDTLRNTLCDHCSFMIRETSTTNSASINNIWQKSIVQSNGSMIMENGRLNIYIRGRDVVEGKDYAKWRIWGINESSTWAEWDNLQFRNAPIPMPMISYIYDRNGDGIGDSLRVMFNKPFKNDKGAFIDSLLPILLDVTWENGYTVAFHNPNYKAEDLRKKDYILNLYNDKSKWKSFLEENVGYWEKYIKGDSLIVIATDSTKFSRSVLTFGMGSLLSYISYNDQGKCTSKCPPEAFKYEGYEASVIDRIPPVVVRAEYTMSDEKGCMDKPDGCRDLLKVTLSEPIFAAPNVQDPLVIKNPFSYCFEHSQGLKCSKKDKETDKQSQSYNNITNTSNAYNWEWELPRQKSDEDVAFSTDYTPNTNGEDLHKYDTITVKNETGDNVVNMVYYAKNTADGGTTRMPKAADWIRIRWPEKTEKKDGVDVFYDAEGNTANPREIGVLITGANRYNKEQIKISSIDKEAKPDDPFFSDIKYKGCKYKGNPCADWISDDIKNGKSNKQGYGLFEPGDVTEFLPILKDMNAKEAAKNYPGTVGTIFSISTNIDYEVDKIRMECFPSPNGADGTGTVGVCKVKDSKGKYITLATKEDFDNYIAEGITLHASAYYHTNIGNYTAHRDPVAARCTDKVFRKKGGPDDNTNNCYSNNYDFYLAWDLKTNKNRFAGTGAYVGITKFYWQIEYMDGDGIDQAPKFAQEKFVEMFGIRRDKGEK